MIRIKKCLYAEVYGYKFSGKTSDQEKKAVAYLFKVNKKMFEKKYNGFYVLRGGHRFKDYSIELHFKLEGV